MLCLETVSVMPSADGKISFDEFAYGKIIKCLLLAIVVSIIFVSIDLLLHYGSEVENM